MTESAQPVASGVLADPAGPDTEVLDTVSGASQPAMDAGGPGARTDKVPRASWARRHRAWLYGGGVVVLVAGAAIGVWLGTSSSASTTGVPTITVTTAVVTVATGTMKQVVAATGTVEPAQESALDFEVSGTVTAVNVSAGQDVTVGQVLATVGTTALAAQASAAQAAVTAAESKLTSDEDDDASTSELASDKASVTSAKDQLTTAEKNLADANLTSPIAGVVASIDVTVGEQVGSGANASHGSGTNSGSSTSEVEVVSADSYIVNCTVDDTEVGEVHDGDQAVIKATSSGTRAGATSTRGGSNTGAATTTTAAAAAIYGTVASVTEVATGTSTVASFPIVVNVTGNPTGIYAGASVSVTLIVKQLTDVVEVTTAALHDTGTQQSVVLVESTGRHVTQPVTTGTAETGKTQITKGLSAGDRIVEQQTTFHAPTGATKTGTTLGGGHGNFRGPGGTTGGTVGGFKARFGGGG